MNGANKNEIQSESFTPFFLSKKFLVSVSYLLIGISIFLVAYFLFFCKINTVEVKNNSIYSEEQIIQAANIKLGKHTYSINKGKIENSIISQCPAVKQVEIRRKSPTKLVLEITEENTLFYSEFSGDYFIFTPSLLVIEMTDDKNYLKEKGYIQIIFAGESRTVVGQKIEFYDNKQYDFYSSLCNAIVESPLYKFITKADLSNKYILKLYEGSLYTFNLGNFSSFEEKILLASQIREYAQNAYPEKQGTIYVSDEKKGSFVAK